jgi:hypothetical protein
MSWQTEIRAELVEWRVTNNNLSTQINSLMHMLQHGHIEDDAKIRAFIVRLERQQKDAVDHIDALSSLLS